MRAFVLVATCVMGWLGLEGLAVACSYSLPDAFEIRADDQDVTPPAAPRINVERVKRGKEPEREGCSFSTSSCDGTGYVLLDVEGDDAGAESPELGYLLEVTGKAPKLSFQPSRPVAPSHLPGQLLLAFTDSDGEKHYEFDIYVWSVDRAGNVSEEPTKVHIESGDADGCRAAASSAHGSWLAVCSLLWVARRRRAST